MSVLRHRSSFALLALAAFVFAFTAGCEQLAEIEDLQDRANSDDGADAADPSAANRSDSSTSSSSSTEAPPFDAGLGDATIDEVLKDAGTITPTLAFPHHLALGSTHSCTILLASSASPASGRVLCWGSNASGQLGQGAGTSSSDALAVPGVDHATAIAAGAAHTCAINEDGGILCWGRADQGQLGGKPSELGAVVRVNTNGERALQVTAGALHTCALLEHSGVKCWGDNAFGQVGDGSLASASANVVAVFSGGFFSCALKKNGALACWGDNTYGQIGDRTKTTRPSPVGVLDLNVQIRDVALGQNTACVVTSLNALECWGRNRPIGEVGTAAHGIVVPFTPSLTEFTSPTLTSAAAATDGGAPSLAFLSAISVNANHACARSIGGHAICWGSNAKQQLGVASPSSGATGFHDVDELAGIVKEIAVGFTHSCAIGIEDDEVYCWGGNEFGQLGSTASPPRAKPERVARTNKIQTTPAGSP